MGYKAAVQVLKQTEDLKIKVSSKCDWLNNAEAWTNQQKLQAIYHQVLVLDLEYALDKKVEQDLWNIGFKNHISSLQELARDKKNPNRSDCQALLTWALEAASGFYITLLQELCNMFDLDLPFRRRGSVFGQTTRNSELSDLPQTSSCLYICQYCLVHLGDISRYRNQRTQAESFYKQAILVSPTSGHPYNQLALLEASQGNKLSTVFYYIRGIAVKNPFPASVTNLSSTLNSTIDKESNHPDKIQTKMTVNEFVQLFMCTHAYFHACAELRQAETSVKSLNSVMTALVATQSFAADALVKMASINLYSLERVGARNERTSDEKKVRELVLDLIAGSLSALLMPVHTLKMDEALMDYYALPAVKLILYFVQNEPDVLKEKVFTNRLQIWPSLVKLLNNVLKYLKGINFNKYSKYPLPEDKDLQGFLPLSKNFKDFDFKEDIDDVKMERLVRIKRIVNISLWLTDTDVNGTKLIVKSEKDGEINFEPVCIQPDPTNDLLEEMKSISIVKNSEINEKKGGIERKTGILKPQGSLEKSREERELLSSSTSAESTASVSNILNSHLTNNKIDPKTKKGKQNIALQSIFKKMEENKQVKFIVDEPTKDPRPLTFDPAQKQSFAQPPPTSRPPPFNAPFSLPPPAPQPDYLAALRSVPNMQMDFQYAPPKKDTNNVMMGMVAPPPPRYQKPPVGYHSHAAQQGSYVQTSMPYQNVSLPPSHPFNAWNHRNPSIEQEAPPMPNPAWWQNTAPPPPAPSGYRPDFLGFPAYPPSNYKPPGGGGGDIFKSPWSSSYSGGGMEGEPAGGAAGQGMSIRQAMLKEAGSLPCSVVGPPGSNLQRISNPPPPESSFVQSQPAAPGYSLFNNSWTPNLAGQLRGGGGGGAAKPPPEGAAGRPPQQSLFSGHGPKSLAQLLEQQSQLGKRDS